MFFTSFSSIIPEGIMWELQSWIGVQHPGLIISVSVCLLLSKVQGGQLTYLKQFMQIFMLSPLASFLNRKHDIYEFESGCGQYFYSFICSASLMHDFHKSRNYELL